MVGAAFMVESWNIPFTDAAERAAWATRAFSEHPHALEVRNLMAFQLGHRQPRVQHGQRIQGESAHAGLASGVPGCQEWRRRQAQLERADA